MDRMIDMKKSSTVFLDGLLNERVGKAGKYFEKEKDAWIDIFRSEMRVLADMRKENEKNPGTDRENENLIEGRNAVLEAFRSGKTIDKLLVLDGCQDGPVWIQIRHVFFMSRSFCFGT